MSRLTYTRERDARRAFNREVAPSIPSNDTAALDDAWGQWLDSLCKSGQITENAYNTWTRD